MVGRSLLKASSTATTHSAMAASKTPWALVTTVAPAATAGGQAASVPALAAWIHGIAAARSPRPAISGRAEVVDGDHVRAVDEVVEIGRVADDVHRLDRTEVVEAGRVRVSRRDHDHDEGIAPAHGATVPSPMIVDNRPSPRSAPMPELEPLERRPTATLIAEAVRTGITDGTFPSGTQLTEAQLAEQLAVSRGPLREALQRLVQEGLVVSEPNRGVFVADLAAEDAADVYLARSAIEQAAARLVVRQGRSADLRPLRDLVREMAKGARANDFSAVAEADLRFHEALVAASGSPRLVRMYATLLAETRLCLLELPVTDPDPKAIVAEHKALLDALRTGDEAAALACVAEHLDRTAVAHDTELPL